MSIAAANLPPGRKTYLDNNGRPLAGGLVSYFLPDTTQLAVIYADDMQGIVAQNPLTLDAAGACTTYAVGQFREVVTDQLGNTISDQIVVAGTPVIVTDAMRPVIEAATPADAEAILKGSTATTLTSLDIEGDQSLNTTPTANAPATKSSLNVQGTATFANDREFLCNFGLTSPVGASGPAGNDKVTLYAGMEAQGGTSNVWSFNTVLGLEPNSGDYTAQGYELDLNNSNVDRGNSGNLNLDFSPPNVTGLTLSGAGAKTSTVGIGILSVNPQLPVWNRGIATIGTFPLTAYQEWSTTPVGFQFDGAYAVAALNLTSIYGNAGAVTNTALFMKVNQSLTWQSADGLSVMSDGVDSNNNRTVGISNNASTSQIILGGNTIPETPGMALGSHSNHWGEFFVQAIRLPNAAVLTWDANPAASSPPANEVIDFVDQTNSRVVGSGAQTVYSGSQLAPLMAGFNLGTPANYWGVIYSSGGIQAPSDIRLKEAIAPLPSALAGVDAIEPISFRFKGQSDVHYGFNAAEVQQNFSELVTEHDGIKHLKQTDMVAVLWQAMKELFAEVKGLKDCEGCKKRRDAWKK